MSFQELTREDGKTEILLTIIGQDLIGMLVNAPLSVYNQIFILPMKAVNCNKVQILYLYNKK
jgi:hypothetical protein